ncbi:hypothetical protein EXIGLDRAFT_300346 [Exidia glandulosa HHB12029]|uniref:Uncharacterized protein n=1 Tax=Exidia glandulosa HHB12029 TaxID=1314781 RepID=A0A165ZM94_EXIGL|nr:hypothetical protein EXIGLDRAFT_300346 [Exidia glandulosa HHB12029]
MQIYYDEDDNGWTHVPTAGPEAEDDAVGVAGVSTVFTSAAVSCPCMVRSGSSRTQERTYLVLLGARFPCLPRESRCRRTEACLIDQFLMLRQCCLQDESDTGGGFPICFLVLAVSRAEVPRSTSGWREQDQQATHLSYLSSSNFSRTRPSITSMSSQNMRFPKPISRPTVRCVRLSIDQPATSTTYQPCDAMVKLDGDLHARARDDIRCQGGDIVLVLNADFDL